MKLKDFLNVVQYMNKNAEILVRQKASDAETSLESLDISIKCTQEKTSNGDGIANETKIVLY